MGKTAVTINENGHIDMEKGSLWVNTPHGLVSIHIGFGGVHKITSWLPHDLKISKTTSRGNMQVTKLEASFESICKSEVRE